jgi:hypothetical protein
MNPLTKLSNTERAGLLFELFPEEIPKFLQFIIEFTNAIIADPDTLKNEAIDQIHTTEFWQRLVNNAKSKLDQYGNELAKNSKLFSEKLFDGYNSIYVGYCLHQYIIKDQTINSKFKSCVFLLFF